MDRGHGARPEWRVSLTTVQFSTFSHRSRATGRTPLEVFRRPELENAVRAVLAGEPGQVLEIIAGEAGSSGQRGARAKRFR